MGSSRSIRFLILGVVLSAHGTNTVRATFPPGVLDAGDRTIVTVGQSVTLSGLMEVPEDPPPIGYPGPIMRDFAPPLYEKLEGDHLVPIRALLLLIPPRGQAARRNRQRMDDFREDSGVRLEDPTVSVLVIGRYFRFLGAPAMLVTSITIGGLPVSLSAGDQESRLSRLAMERVKGHLRDRIRILPDAGRIETWAIEVVSTEAVLVEVPANGHSARFLYRVSEDEVRLLSGLLP